MSADGTTAITLIAFIGSVFSPYYALARSQGRGNPLQHCAMNVALYGRYGQRWAMTERGARHVERSASQLVIGRSEMSFNGGDIRFYLDEISAPLPRRVRGTVHFMPSLITEQSYPLDAQGMHQWRPAAPIGWTEVSFSEPDLHWSGPGYFDCNRGVLPLEQSFDEWHWSRASDAARTTVLYDVACKGGDERQLSLQFSNQGVEPLEAPTTTTLPPTRWGLTRKTRAAHKPPRLLKTLEDGPFYSRSLLSAEGGGRAFAVHESLSLRRFRSTWVKCLLPFRMPRRIG